jgi:hypothetical protein
MGKKSVLCVVQLVQIKVSGLPKITANYLEYELCFGIWCETLEEGWDCVHLLKATQYGNM